MNAKRKGFILIMHSCVSILNMQVVCWNYTSQHIHKSYSTEVSQQLLEGKWSESNQYKGMKTQTFSLHLLLNPIPCTHTTAQVLVGCSDHILVGGSFQLGGACCIQ